MVAADVEAAVGEEEASVLAADPAAVVETVRVAGSEVEV